MSKELKNLTKSVMGQIHQGKVKMRPKIYFILGSIFTFVGLVLSILTSVFLISFIRFSLLSRGPMGEYRLEELLSHFSWFGPMFAVLGLMVGIWFLLQYDFSYKVNFKVIVAVFVTAVIVAGIILDMTGLNDVVFRHGKMRGKMQWYLQENNTKFNNNITE